VELGLEIIDLLVTPGVLQRLQPAPPSTKPGLTHVTSCR
jgi:hypothetical protein